jgi:hypothetical protein
MWGGTNKHFQQSIRVQNQQTKISIFLYTPRVKHQKRYQEYNFIHIRHRKITKCLGVNLTKRCKTLGRQSNSEQKEHCWRYHNTWFQTIVQSHSNKHNIVLAWKQTCRTMEQNIILRNKPSQLHSSGSWQRCQKHTVEKYSLFSILENWIWRRLKLDPF